jgi:hypothetical protein
MTPSESFKEWLNTRWDVLQTVSRLRYKKGIFTRIRFKSRLFKGSGF